MNFALNIILIFFILFGYFIEDIYLWKFPPKISHSSNLSIRSKINFDFDQEKSYGTIRNIAISKYIPLYIYDSKNFDISKNKLQHVINKIIFLKKENNNVLNGKEFDDFLKKELDLNIGVEAALKILQYNDIDNILKGILAIEESILQNKIVSDQMPLKDKDAVEIAFSKPVGTIIYPRIELLTLEEARISLSNKISQIFWQVDQNILVTVIQIASSTLLPNLKYDKNENNRRIEEIIRRFPSKIISYRIGDVLVPFRKSISEEDILKLQTYKQKEKIYFYTKAPIVVFIIIILVLLYNLLMSSVFTSLYINKSQLLVMLSVLITSIIILKSYLLFTPFIIYSLPIAIIPITAMLLRIDRIPIILMTAIGAILVSYLVGPDYIFIFFNCTAGIVAILATPKIKRYSDIILTCIIVASVNAALFLILFIDWNIVREVIEVFIKNNILSLGKIFPPKLLEQTGWAFLGGLLAAPVAFMLLPCLAFVWRRASVFQIKNYADLEHPLLKELLTKAPGTYQHSMMVAHLAQAAAEAVGAHALLVRIGAYYHDIGKILNPEMFIENQFGGKNPHDELTPLQSAQIIKAHTVQGLKMGEEAHLPEIILDFIPQHHGTLLLEYFYQKAVSLSESKEVNEAAFRYAGPKPQYVETAILMIADAVEAASRTLSDSSAEKIDALIRLIIQNRINDGQFDECNLSTLDLAKIRKALIHTMMASLHNRVKYPWQEEESSNVSV